MNYVSRGGIIVECDSWRNYGSDEYPIYRFKLLFPEQADKDKVYAIRDAMERFINKIPNSHYYRDYCSNAKWTHLSSDYSIEQANRDGHCIYHNIAHNSLFPGFSTEEHRDLVMNLVIDSLKRKYKFERRKRRPRLVGSFGKAI